MIRTQSDLDEFIGHNGLFVGRALDLRGTRITALPDGLSVGGALYLSGTGITGLPDGLSVGGSLDLRGTRITALPDGLSVGGALDLRGTRITALPDGLSVGGSLALSGTGVTGRFGPWLVAERHSDDDYSVVGRIDDEGRIEIRAGCFAGTIDEATARARGRAVYLRAIAEIQSLAEEKE